MVPFETHLPDPPLLGKLRAPPGLLSQCLDGAAIGAYGWGRSAWSWAMATFPDLVLDRLRAREYESTQNFSEETMFNATIIGNVGADPEATKSGKSWKFRVAVNQGYGDKENTVWLNVFSNDASLAKVLTKGCRVVVVGRAVVDEAEAGNYWPPTIFASDVKILNWPKDGKSAPPESARKAGPAADSGF